MSFLYIGAAVVVGLLVGFVALTVLWLTKSVGKSIESRTVNLISEYDDLLDARSRELIRAEARVAAASQAASQPSALQAIPTQDSSSNMAVAGILNTAQRMGTTEYRDSAIVALYHQIRDGFKQNEAEIFSRLHLMDNDAHTGVATKLLQSFDFDVVYELCTLPSEMQYQIVAETIGEQNTALLAGYTQQHAKFNGLDFYNYLKDLADMEPKPPVVRMAPGTVFSVQPPNATIIVDENICEGFQVETRNTLYDFCIKAKEIG